MFGKIATATYIMTGVVALYYNYLGVTSTVVTVFVYASLAITLLSAFDYAIHVLRLGRAPERTGQTEGLEAEIETATGLRPGHEGTKARRTRRNLH
jgi:hypothetical protein